MRNSKEANTLIAYREVEANGNANATRLQEATQIIKMGLRVIS
jgi:hypothetical protein